MGFKEFLPQGYSNLMVYDKIKKEKVSVPAELLISFRYMSDSTTVVAFYEGNKRRLVLTPYSMNQIVKIFSEGE